MLTTAQLDRIEGDALALFQAVQAAGPCTAAGDDAELDPSRVTVVAGSVPQLVAEIRAARSEQYTAEHAALDASLDGDAHAVYAILADLPLNRLRALAFATQVLSTSSHNRALARLMNAAGAEGVDLE